MVYEDLIGVNDNILERIVQIHLDGGGSDIVIMLLSPIRHSNLAVARHALRRRAQALGHQECLVALLNGRVHVCKPTARL